MDAIQRMRRERRIALILFAAFIAAAALIYGVLVAPRAREEASKPVPIQVVE